MTAITVAICRTVDGASPCPFVSCCHETRQRIQHYAPRGSLRGMACWAYSHLADILPSMLQPPSEEASERAAIAAEGNA